MQSIRKPKTNAKAWLAAAALVAAGTAAAQDGLTAVQVRAQLEAQGYTAVNDVEFDDGADAAAQLSDLLLLDPAEVDDLVTAQLPGSALFAARFRECAARALLFWLPICGMCPSPAAASAH